MKANHVILGVHITNRLKNAAEVQKVFTDFGCHIKTRLGLHEVTPEYCAGEGIVLLEIVGGDDVRERMVKQLGAIDGIDVREMVFRHE